MLFDLTPEITLDKENQKKYLYARVILYVSALVFAFFAAFTIIFPTRYFSFSFLNPNSKSNTIVNPRDETGNSPDRGKIMANNKFIFDATLLGNFSEAKIIFRLNKKSSEIDGEKISIRKSFQAFLYPEGSPFGFRDGALLKNLENYYLVSNGKLRKFKDKNTLSLLGFSTESFQEVSIEDLNYNAQGNNISDTSTYPSNSLFKINNDFYILSDTKLTKFISDKAYLSQYYAEQAIPKTADFLQKYPQDENQIGFADGSLIAYGESAYAVSGNESFPIDSIETFEAMGYRWEDLITVGGDEISFYTKDTLLDLAEVHPDGTIFSSFDKKYITQDKEKHLLPSEKIASSWSKINSIEVSDESISIFSECDFRKKYLFSRNYSCIASIDNLQNLLGKDYEFNVIFNSDIKVDSAEIQFKKSYTVANFKRFIANVIKNIKNSYVGQN